MADCLALPVRWMCCPPDRCANLCSRAGSDPISLQNSNRGGAMATQNDSAPWWSWVWPAAAWATILVASFLGVSPALAAVAGVVLIGTVFAAVHHAEVIAHRIG